VTNYICGKNKKPVERKKEERRGVTSQISQPRRLCKVWGTAK